MSDAQYVFQKIEDRPVNYVRVMINTESGCDASIGEYSLFMVGFLGHLSLDSPGGTDDITLIKECIENHLDFTKLPEEGSTEIILKESGEWEDVFWHKYYIIERVTALN